MKIVESVLLGEGIKNHVMPQIQFPLAISQRVLWYLFLISPENVMQNTSHNYHLSVFPEAAM